MNILYYIELEYGTIEASEFDQIRNDLPIKKIFENLCLQELTTLKGRIDAVKKIFGYSYNVPVYINSDLIYFKIKCKNKIWINLKQVGSIIKLDEGSGIVFKGGKSLKTTTSYRSLLNSYKRALRIIQE